MHGREALLRHPLALAGAIITTASAVVMIALIIAMLGGLLQNPYAGLIVFIALPACFVAGLILIPIGVRLQRRKLARDPTALDWPVLDFRLSSVRRTALMIVALTAVNIVILLVAGYGTLHSMETPAFCGQACHQPMQPQFTAWQQASHAHVACVSCHIAEGARGFLQAKLSGVRQLVQVATNTYPRPIPPGAKMSPGGQAETCVSCHQPGRGTGDHIRVIREYADDEKNTETMTVLQMHLGASSSSKQAIHWHADPAVRVEYVSTDAARETIPYVRVDRNGVVKEYRAEGATDQMISGGSRRTMDCIDCHNTVGHPISPTPERVVDEAMAATRVSPTLAFARRESVRVLKESYPSQDDGVRAIDRELRKFFGSSAGSADPAAVAQTVAAVQDIYRHNVFPTMKVTWGSYPNNKGHITATGCFRCHDDGHKASDGSTISGDCSYCHTQIEPGDRQ